MYVLTLPSSTQRVSMTIVGTLFSHTISQNLPTVTPVGPTGDKREERESEQDTEMYAEFLPLKWFHLERLCKLSSYQHSPVECMGICSY